MYLSSTGELELICKAKDLEGISVWVRLGISLLSSSIGVVVVSKNNDKNIIIYVCIYKCVFVLLCCVIYI